MLGGTDCQSSLVRGQAQDGKGRGAVWECYGRDVEYDEEEPDAYLLCKDLHNLAMRGVERVELTILRDGKGSPKKQ